MRKKMSKKDSKSQKVKKKGRKHVEMQTKCFTFLIWVYTSQNVAQTQQNCWRSYDRTTVTFRSCDVKEVVEAPDDTICVTLQTI